MMSLERFEAEGCGVSLPEAEVQGYVEHDGRAGSGIRRLGPGCPGDFVAWWVGAWWELGVSGSGAGAGLDFGWYLIDSRGHGRSSRDESGVLV